MCILSSYILSKFPVNLNHLYLVLFKISLIPILNYRRVYRLKSKSAHELKYEYLAYLITLLHFLEVETGTNM